MRHRAYAVSHVELDVDTVEITLDRRRRYGKHFGDLRAGAAIGDKLKDTKLSCRQAVSGVRSLHVITLRKLRQLNAARNVY